MNTSEVLNKAADLIEERGWQTGAGWEGVAETGALCIEGAIQAAMGVAVGSGYRCPAYTAVADYLGRRDGLFMWNDSLPYADGTPRRGYVGGSPTSGMAHGERTVIETLRAAALVEQAREDAALLAEAGRSA